MSMQNPSHNSKHLERIVRYSFRVRAVHESASRFLCRWSIMCDWAVWLIERVKTDWWTGRLELTNWLINWFPDSPNDWLPHWLNLKDLSTDWLTDWLTHWLFNRLIYWLQLMDGLIGVSIDRWLIFRLVEWFIVCLLACLLSRLKTEFINWFD